MARNIWEGLGAGIIGAGNAVGGAISQMPTKEELEKLALARRYQEAQIKNLDADNARLEAAARGEQAKAEMDLGIKKANINRMAELSPLLGEYPILRGAPSGEGRYSQLSDTIKPQIDSSAFGITPKTGMGAPTAENPYDISKFSKQAAGAMEISPDLAKLRSEDLRKAQFAKLSPQQVSMTVGSATSSLPADIEAAKNLTKMQSDEDEYAKEQRRQAEFGAELGVKRLAAANKGVPNEYSINNKEVDRYLSAKDKFETKLLASRGQLGKQNELIDRVDRDLSLIDGALSGKQPMTAQKWSELNAGLMNVIGGSISQGSLEHLTSTSIVQEAMNKLQYLSNSPQAAVDPAFIKDVRDSFKRMRDITTNKRDKRVSTMLDGYEEILTPEHIENLRNIGKSFSSKDGEDGGESGANSANTIKSKSGKVYNF